MYYLTDEVDGALELPSFEFKLLPMENLCVIMRTGFMHKVNKCSGSRINITGWSYAAPSRLTKNTLKGYDQL
jgi:Rps23 Pro-64 3,4-dihydroxylase Tpa1-like proline 4-hydroxylase